MPPPIVLLLLAGAGAIAGYRWLNKRGATLSEDLKRAQDELRRRATGKPLEKNLGGLKQDPKTGEYRPDDEAPKA